jgi:hypothetical protein
MTTTSTSSAFDDSDQLTTYMQDQRGADTVQLSSIDDAVAIIETFRSSTATSPWNSLERGKVADRLEEIVRNPRVITQGALNLCGPAAFFNIVAGRHPVAVAQAATALFDTGACDIGGLHIAPKSDLTSVSYSDVLAKMGSSPAPQAEWMLLGALRNTTNVFWQPDWKGDPSQELAGLTRPEELASWFTATGFFAKVSDGGKWASNPGIPNAENLSLAAGTDNAVLINTNLLAATGQTTIDNSFILSSFPNHWVTLLSDVVADTTNKVVNVSFWTWGTPLLGLSIPQQAFLDNYYGAVTTTLPAQN